jgi:hypothetical protein
MGQRGQLAAGSVAYRDCRVSQLLEPEPAHRRARDQQPCISHRTLAVEPHIDAADALRS